MINESLVSDLGIFSSRYGLKPIEAMLLPALFEKAANLAEPKLAVRSVINSATYKNIELGNEIALLAKSLAKNEEIQKTLRSMVES